MLNEVLHFYNSGIIFNVLSSIVTILLEYKHLKAQKPIFHLSLT